MDKTIEIPENKTIEIPEGYEARIEGNKVILMQIESEDERIRKELVSFIQKEKEYMESKVKPENSPRLMFLIDTLAYLERQKDKMTAEEYEKSEPFQLKLKTQYVNGYQDGLTQKQKPADNSVYPPSLEEAIQLYYGTYGNGKGGFDHISLPKFQDIVKTFVKDYGQKFTEWSDKDREFIKDLCNLLAAIAKNNYVGCYYAPELINKIRSLRPQPHWKPSEEQIDHLAYAYTQLKLQKCYAPHVYETLGSLYDDLKKQL